MESCRCRSASCRRLSCRARSRTWRIESCRSTCCCCGVSAGLAGCCTAGAAAAGRAGVLSFFAAWAAGASTLVLSGLAANAVAGRLVVSGFCATATGAAGTAPQALARSAAAAAAVAGRFALGSFATAAVTESEQVLYRARTVESCTAARRMLSRWARMAVRSTASAAGASSFLPQAARPRRSPASTARVSRLGATGHALRGTGLHVGADLEARLQQGTGTVTERLGPVEVGSAERQLHRDDDPLQARHVGQELAQLVVAADHRVLVLVGLEGGGPRLDRQRLELGHLDPADLGAGGDLVHEVGNLVPLRHQPPHQLQAGAVAIQPAAQVLDAA